MNTPKLPPLPERDPRKPAEQQGVFRKFDVRRTDGSSEPGGKHHGCEYFVLDVDHDQAARAALKAYADAVEATHPLLAADMRERYALAAIQAQGVPDDVAQQINRLVSAAFRKGELWERYQGKGWPEAGSNEFVKLRDETIPDAIAQLQWALASAPPAPQAERVPMGAIARVRKALAGRKFREASELEDLLRMAANVIAEDGTILARMEAKQASVVQQEPALTTCNCRWDGETQVQQCTLHEAHIDAIHEWAERAKTAEAKLSAQQAKPQPLSDGDLFDGWISSRVCTGSFGSRQMAFNEGARFAERRHGIVKE